MAPDSVGTQGYLERRRFREVLQRPHDCPIRRRDLECQAVSGAIERIAHMTISPLAGKPAPKEMLIDPAQLERDYFERKPDLDDPRQLVSFGTSGHRGSPLRGSFTEAHILAITQAICDYRHAQGADGPLYMGKDTLRFPGRPSAPRWKFWRPTGCRRSS